MLDIYICRLGNFEAFKSKNQFLICQEIKNGIPLYQDQAQALGVDFSGLSTQAAFFDFDLDGDLDLFLLNHSVHQNGSFAPRSHFLNTYNPISGDQLYRNDGQKFTNITKSSNIHSSAISYGLGLVISDINLDGYPDIYNGNDFHENDYLYINQKNGKFKDLATTMLQHTSQYTMGVDIADANNDGLPEILTMDMLPFEPEMLKRTLGEDDYEIYRHKILVGYHYQYTRNSLQWNRGNNLFSEIGLYAGMFATDWSWANFFTDFNNDGLKDIFVANGIPKRMNDIDYVNFISNENYQNKIQNFSIEQADFEVINKFPEIKLANKFFLNLGNLKFKDIASTIKNNPLSFSNGAIVADLDNDGDEDIVVNNVNDPVFIYENKSSQDTQNHYINITLYNPKQKNRNELGAKIVVYAQQEKLVFENYPVRGFMSSMQKPIHIGYGQKKIDSIIVIWNDFSYQKIDLNHLQKNNLITKSGLQKFNYERFTNLNEPYLVNDITRNCRVDFKHEENDFREFNRERLIPHFNSTFGPALAVADVNGDGLEDFFVGGARNQKSSLYLQQKNGQFKPTSQDFKPDLNFEDVDAQFTDFNNDGFLDLVIASGGNEYYGSDNHLLSRVYLNNGQGFFTYLDKAITNFINAKLVRTLDFNHDGWQDIFIAEKTVPFNYGQSSKAYFLQNNTHNKFIDVTQELCPEIQNVGMITDVQFVDFKKNNHLDMIVCSEWGTIDFFKFNANKYRKQPPIISQTGWWNFIYPCDINKDGYTDFILGNHGLNSRLQANNQESLHLYLNDFDDNGQLDPILTYILNGKEIPFANKDELQKQIPFLKKKFLYAADFAKAEWQDFFPEQKLSSAKVLSANYLNNAILINKHNDSFSLLALPWQAQITSYSAAMTLDNNKSFKDIFLLGNYFDNNIQMGRQDADYGTILCNNQIKDNMILTQHIESLNITNQVRKMSPITIRGKQVYILAKNHAALQIIEIIPR